MINYVKWQRWKLWKCRAEAFYSGGSHGVGIDARRHWSIDGSHAGRVMGLPGWMAHAMGQVCAGAELQGARMRRGCCGCGGFCVTLRCINCGKVFCRGKRGLLPQLTQNARLRECSMKILIINGPNLNLLGVREKSIYGSEPFDGFLEGLRAAYPEDEIEYFQSNHEGAIIDKLHSAGFDCDGIVLNAGAYTHTSIAIADAIRAINAPVVEVHISNVAAREDYRHVSMIAPACKGVIAGFGLDSYRLAVEALKGC